MAFFDHFIRQKLEDVSLSYYVIAVFERNSIENLKQSVRLWSESCANALKPVQWHVNDADNYVHVLNSLTFLGKSFRHASTNFFTNFGWLQNYDSGLSSWYKFEGPNEYIEQLIKVSSPVVKNEQFLVNDDSDYFVNL